MTETTCTTCGARCRQNEMYSECNTSQSLIALPSPDLTKLREAFTKLPTDEDIIDLYTNEQIVDFFLDIKTLVQAVKELMEENKPL